VRLTHSDFFSRSHAYLTHSFHRSVLLFIPIRYPADVSISKIATWNCTSSITAIQLVEDDQPQSQQLIKQHQRLQYHRP